MVLTGRWVTEPLEILSVTGINQLCCTYFRLSAVRISYASKLTLLLVDWQFSSLLLAESVNNLHFVRFSNHSRNRPSCLEKKNIVCVLTTVQLLMCFYPSLTLCTQTADDDDEDRRADALLRTRQSVELLRQAAVVEDALFYKWYYKDHRKKLMTVNLIPGDSSEILRFRVNNSCPKSVPVHQCKLSGNMASITVILY